MTEDIYPPLISPRSPSYERARAFFEQPVAGGSAELVALLSQLSEAEQNATEVCTRMAKLLAGDAIVATISEHSQLHAARRLALSELVSALGGSAPTPEECRDLLMEACAEARRVSAPDDARRVLQRMRSELAEQYAQAAQQSSLTAAQRSALVQLAPDAAKI